ncbi:phospholipid-binding protein MlaC [Paracoccus sp. MC1862]|uniref:MlaC/ttg2D family ABC transporter substrate-binding protein n=1 Tax=Paracoccus sp. MC1862 TaxID=2760307 RepID=UPI0015FFF5D4|nr:ABC transporter substrate-binding protein [Paracoccus sp. MC1862]MBB1496710.1 ABC transporter substrate-binding protein [Paracoccus sp. MC1862]QQO43719.1 ABC transporter substrate-binding protein [Paracoccus sp. MC1862]
MPNSTRRGFLGLLAMGGAMAVTPAQAMTAHEASASIRRAVDEVLAVVNSGQPPAQLFAAFETIFAKRADIDAIARSALGPAARQMEAANFREYREAMTGYIARKYGRRFQEFLGSRIEVGAARPLKSFWAVSSTAYLNGRSPMEVEWHISDKTGQPRFFNLIIEGVNMLASEREEIGAMLARRRGDMDALIKDLRQLG